MTIMDRMTSSSWQDNAKCKDLSAVQADALFFVGRGGTSVPAKKFCGGSKDTGPACPVMSACSQYGYHSDSEGFWAGFGERDRIEFSAWFLPDNSFHSYTADLDAAAVLLDYTSTCLDDNDSPIDLLLGLEGPSDDDMLDVG